MFLSSKHPLFLVKKQLNTQHSGFSLNYLDEPRIMITNSS